MTTMLPTDSASASLDSALETTFTCDDDRAGQGLDQLDEKAKS